MFKVMLNHAIAILTGPLGLWFIGMAVAGILMCWKKKRLAGAAAILSTLILWTFSSGWFGRVFLIDLERAYPPVPMDQVPTADVIVILGGGMGANPEAGLGPEMFPSADRVWYAARLWKAGKAPFVMASGANELCATKPLLLDFGLPESAIRIENESRNTEENAKCVRRMCPRKPDGSRPKVLLVTSAWHMRRAKLMFERYAPELEIVAAPCDHEGLLAASTPWCVAEFFPNPGALASNSYRLKEIIGYWGYRLLR